MSEEISKLLDCQTRVANDSKHREGIDWIVPWKRDGSPAIRHYDMSALAYHFETSSLERLDS